VASGRCLAIDFGTCYSSAARMIDGRPEPVKDPIKHVNSTPSTVLRTRRGDLVVGWLAENGKRSRAGDYAEEFKRVLGRQPVVMGDTEVPAEELVTEVLRFIKEEAEKTDGAYERALVTVPASYEAKRRELMVEAAQAAGFAEVELLDEPAAAAMARTRRAEGDELVLVYDLGGGTFDAALVEFSGGRVTVVDSDGIDTIGGANFDRAIEADLAAQAGDVLKEAFAGLRDKDRGDEWIRAKQAELTARDFCEEIKKQLSLTEYAENDLVLGGPPILYELTRERLEELIDDELAATVDCCSRLIDACGRSWDDVDGILMVGGSCRLPFIRERLTRETGRPIKPVLDLELAVCMGAALSVQLAEEEEKRRVEEERELDRQAAKEEQRRKLQRKRAEAAKREREGKPSAAAITAANTKTLTASPYWGGFDLSVRTRLQAQLEEGEEVEGVFKCERMQDWMENTAMLLTSRRLLWARTSWATGLVGGSVWLADIRSIEATSVNPTQLRIVATSGSHTFQFVGSRGVDAERIAERVQTLKRQPAPAARDGGGATSGADTPVDALEISIRARNGLRTAGITTAGQITAKTELELAALPNFGIRLAREVLAAAQSVLDEEPAEEAEPADEEPAEDSAAPPVPAKRSRLVANRKRLVQQPSWRSAADEVRHGLMDEVNGAEDVLEVAGYNRAGSRGIVVVTSERVVLMDEAMGAARSVALEDVGQVRRPSRTTVELGDGADKIALGSVSRPAKLADALVRAAPEIVRA
jgi:molecular chaperone DnaK